MFTTEAMQARFHEIAAKRAAIHAVSMPLREERDAFAQKARARETELNDAIKAAEDGLFDLDQEASALVRALKGKTGPAPKS